MWKYSRYFLGATLFCISTVTVVYASLPRELSKNKADVVYRINREVDLNAKSGELVLGYKTKDSTDIANAFLKEGGENLFGVFRYVFFSLNGRKIGSELTSMSHGNYATLMQKMEGLRESIIPVVQNLNPPKASNLHQKNNIFAIIPASYATSTQSQQQQQINRSIYIDIRTKITYLETLLDTLEAMKKSGTSINFAQIEKESSNQLQKNINKLSKSGELEKALERNIPINLAGHEQEYVTFAKQQIVQAGQITGFEASVTTAMNQAINKSEWAKQIAIQVHDELKRQAVPALW
ncbi:hypothetical protein [Nostoc sp. LEGE 12450]|uniref:hypothetical protein n=1 Tax=Nostoc sp. LEGE 12450 TaxID=1828643 RepID=UPI00187F3C43|nr:hypothetical protein [Nostoc sp. LEGE 12450]MBE8991277.1 hypothetical protein [Nostoc sp. LEGE 12450]